MSIPLITIGIPFYNAEKYLDFAILSVINQTYKDWFLILVDDGSTDNSLAIAEKYKNDSRIVIIHDGVNRGLVYRLNQINNICTTKYYARMDADDIMHVNRIEKQINYLESHPECDVVGSSAMIIDDKNHILRSAAMQGQHRTFMHPTVSGKSDWFKRNPYDPLFVRAEDHELWQRTYKQSIFYNMAEPLLFYREYGVQSVAKFLLSQKTNRKIFRKYRKQNMTMLSFINLYVGSYLKEALYVLFSIVGKTHVLINMRRRFRISDDLVATVDDLKQSIDPQY